MIVHLYNFFGPGGIKMEVENESFAFLQEEITDLDLAIVQHQIEENEAKMLVIMTNGHQRLITFEIPEDFCTVLDLLETVAEINV